MNYSYDELNKKAKRNVIYNMRLMSLIFREENDSIKKIITLCRKFNIQFDNKGEHDLEANIKEIEKYYE